MLLKILTCGGAGSGKSTIISALLKEAVQVGDPTSVAPSKNATSVASARDGFGFALLEDGLDAGHKRRIKNDTAPQFFISPHRSFLVSDLPGDEQTAANLASVASRSHIAIISVDAREGLTGLSEQYANVCSLVGVRHVVLAINKMDLVDFSQQAFEEIEEAFRSFSEPLGFASQAVIPMVATEGWNVGSVSSRMPWYRRASLLAHLEAVDVEAPRLVRPFRFAVHRAVKVNPDSRGYAGTVASGHVSTGDGIVSALSGRPSTIERIVTGEGDRNEALRGDAVMLVLDGDMDVATGDLLVPATERPEVSDQFAAQLLWMDETHLLPGRSYELRIGAQKAAASITTIKHRIDVHTRQHMAARNLEMDEIGVCNLATSAPIAFDAYSECPATGGFILIDRMTRATVAMGMILFGLRRATNIHVEELFVDKATRARAKHQRATVIWFTGLSGSGKSTIAKRLEKRLHELGKHTYVLDGDNVRHGLNNDLGFTDTDRVENIRRIGEVAKLFADAGLIVMCSFISPFKAERRMVRELLDDGEFVEVYVDASLEECQRRDPKGLYAKALAGKVKNFTGIDSPYEPPESADIHLVTENVTPDDVVDKIIQYLRERERV